jgi:hypothetical protein
MLSIPKYVVCAPSYREDSGGTIFLHQLVHVLNALGEKALLVPMEPIDNISIRSKITRYFYPEKFVVSSDLNTPVARKRDIDDNTIVVYPEVVLGNPLKASKVARWLLYKPGLLRPYKFGTDEIFFKAADGCDLIEETGGAHTLFLWKVNKAYENRNFQDRSGSCYIVRKGEGKTRIPQTFDSLQIDGLDHDEIATIFNKCKTFYSYDEATMFSQYAAICGCDSIVIPGLFRSREEWIENHELGKYGVAYGVDDLDHARETRSLLVEMLKEKEIQGIETVKKFVHLTKSKFFGSDTF